MPQQRLKFPSATTKNQRSQINNFFFKERNLGYYGDNKNTDKQYKAYVMKAGTISVLCTAKPILLRSVSGS